MPRELNSPDSLREMHTILNKLNLAGPLRHNTQQKLALENPHPRDEYVYFDEGPHIYELFGSSSGVTSVTTFIHKDFPHFDGDLVSTRMLCGVNWLGNIKYAFLMPIAREYLNTAAYDCDAHETRLRKLWESEASIELNIGNTRDYLRWRRARDSWPTTSLFAHLKSEVLSSWELNREDAATRGTAMHANVENCYNGEPHETESTEWKLFKKWRSERPWLRPYRSEMIVWSLEHLLSGSVDMIFEDMRSPGTYLVYDWKRSREIKREGFCRCPMREHTPDNTECEGYGTSSITQDLPNCNYVHYSLQLHTYSELLERYYDLKIGGCYLVVLHPDQEDFIELEGLPFRDRVRMLLEQRRESVKLDPRAALFASSLNSAAFTQNMISWNTSPDKVQVKGRLIQTRSSGSPKLKLTENAKTHPEYLVTVHLSNPTHDLYTQLQPELWPANQSTLELSHRVPKFDRPYEAAKSKYTLEVRLFEMADDGSRLMKIAELKSRGFIVVTHPKQSPRKRKTVEIPESGLKAKKSPPATQ